MLVEDFEAFGVFTQSLWSFWINFPIFYKSYGDQVTLKVKH